LSLGSCADVFLPLDEMLETADSDRPILDCLAALRNDVYFLILLLAV